MDIKKAFSLLELAVVLIVISLLVVGTSAGKKIIHNTKLQNVIQDVEKYRTAANTFKITYDAIPGDMVNAEDYFGESNTNNGNGNGNIEWSGTTGTEFYITWQHLSRAGILKGNDTGTRSNGDYLVPGIDAPGASINNVATYRFLYSDVQNKGEKNRLILVGNHYDVNVNAEIKVRDAYNIDKKADDGLAYAGNTLGQSGDCLLGTPLDYEITTITRVCSMYFSVPSLN